MWFKCRRRPRPAERKTRPSVMLRVRPNDGQPIDCDTRIRAAIWEQFLAGLTQHDTT